MLNCYRILDLTTEKAFIAGRVLADFGMEVITIESPGGDLPQTHIDAKEEPSGALSKDSR